MSLRFSAAAVVLAAFIAISLLTAPYVRGALTSDSHVTGNVPGAKDFENFLARDLQSYFEASLNRKVKVRHELLRAAPTQSGVASPKYYLWVEVIDGPTLVSAGAVRVAAVDRSGFEITNFVSVGEIKRNPAVVNQSFPQALVKKILGKAGSS